MKLVFSPESLLREYFTAIAAVLQTSVFQGALPVGVLEPIEFMVGYIQDCFINIIVSSRGTIKLIPLCMPLETVR